MIGWSTTSVALLAALLSQTALTAGESVELFDGTRVEGALAGIDDQAVRLRTATGERSFPRAEVAVLSFGREAPELNGVRGQMVLVADDGSRLACRSLTLADSKLTLATAWAPKIEGVPVERAARLLRPRAHETPDDILRARTAGKIVPGDQDKLLVGDATGKRVALECILNSIDDSKVGITYSGTDTAMDVASVGLVEFARVAPDPGKAPSQTKLPAIGELACTDGSRLALRALKLAGDHLEAQFAFGNLRIPMAAVADLRFGTGGAGAAARVVSLADIKPAEVGQTPFLDEDFPHRIDRSLTGGPLTIGGRTFPRGIAMHARCEMSWDLAGAYKRFNATVGIDDAVAAGTAVLTITANGKALVDRLVLERSGKPQPLRLDVTGVQRLTVLVDFADARLGAGARVNLCDPELVK